MYLDISSIKDKSFSRRKHWAILVDEAMKCKHGFFLKKKLDQIGMISSWLRGLKGKYKIQVNFICCDNARENKKKSVTQKDWALFLNTPQHANLNKMHMLREPFQQLWGNHKQ